MEVIELIICTFWEPREKIPYYLQLCMETWKKNLPNAELILLDYKNLGDYIDLSEIGESLFSGRLPLPQVSDAVRVAFLSKYGGVWLDVDTIILNPDAEKYFLPDPKNRTVLFGGVKSRCSHLAYINAPPATISICIKDWYEHVKKSLQSLKSSTKFTWSFLGNDFINNYAQKHINEVEILSDTLVMPARRISPGKAFKDIYVDYFFYVAKIPPAVSDDRKHERRGRVFVQTDAFDYFFKQIHIHVSLI